MDHDKQENKKEEKILILAIDADGCVYSHQYSFPFFDQLKYQYESEPRQVHTLLLHNLAQGLHDHQNDKPHIAGVNPELLDYIEKLQEQNQYNRIIVCSSSSRYTMGLDFANSQKNATPMYCEELTRLAAFLKEELESLFANEVVVEFDDGSLTDGLDPKKEAGFLHQAMIDYLKNNADTLKLYHYPYVDKEANDEKMKLINNHIKLVKNYIKKTTTHFNQTYNTQELFLDHSKLFVTLDIVKRNQLKYPHAKIDLHFIDNLDEIHQDLHLFIQSLPSLFPKKIAVHAVPYKMKNEDIPDAPSQIIDPKKILGHNYQPVEGTAEPDPNYKEKLRNVFAYIQNKENNLLDNRNSFHAIRSWPHLASIYDPTLEKIANFDAIFGNPAQENRPGGDSDVDSTLSD
ncbi:MAG: hypothetical protein ACK4PR_09565, partial [Gammaproteobacteria bacterium]